MSATAESAGIKTPPSETSSGPFSVSLDTDTLNSLQSREQRELLNEIDKLRGHGVNEFVSLPQLVVCGDQSSGKSSVLEAITEIPFPRRDNLCTRFATQIMLRRSTHSQVHVKIIAGSHRSAPERTKLEAFSADITDFTQLPDIMENAKVLMGIDTGNGGAFSKDTLSIEVCGPDKPQLTIVDLPGLIHTQNRAQSSDDVRLVSELVHGYMADPRTVILAVVSASNDYANQIVLQRAKDADPLGLRTLGIITKPDALPVGSSSEAAFVALASNKDIYFRLGWHVLRNRNYEERDISFEERNKIEKDFFARRPWTSLNTGVVPLRSRLSTLLLEHIKKELPRVHQEISTSLQECEQELKAMGQRRTTPEEQKMLLFRVSEMFGHLCKSGVEGNYENQFFGLIDEGEGERKRLRAQVQALNSSFAERMRLKGHWREIVEDDASIDVERSEDLPSVMTRSEGIDWVMPLLLGGRGRELPGTYNPLLIGELFWAQSQGWERIAKQHVKKIYQRCNSFLKVSLHGLAPADVLESLFAYHIDLKMQERLDRANQELEELLIDRRRHAITYNHYYTENIQNIRDRRFAERCKAVIQAAVSPLATTLTRAQLMEALSAPRQTEDMDEYACEEVLDCMLAFYKVAIKTFVDNVAIIVVERRLVSNLWDIFSPISIAGMSEDTIAAICEESPDDQRRREQLEAKRVSLKGGMQVCTRALRGVRRSVDPVNVKKSVGEDSSDGEEDDAEEVYKKRSPTTTTRKAMLRPASGAASTPDPATTKPRAPAPKVGPSLFAASPAPSIVATAPTASGFPPGGSPFTPGSFFFGSSSSPTPPPGPNIFGNKKPSPPASMYFL